MSHALTQSAAFEDLIVALEDDRIKLQNEAKKASSEMKRYFEREIRKLDTEIRDKKQEFHHWLHVDPYLPKPDLIAKTVRVQVDHSRRRVKFAAVTRNVGLSAARGPFQIDFGITTTKGNQVSTVFRSFLVPADVILFGEPVLSPGFAAARVSDHLPPTTLRREYVTEWIEVPLGYIDESPSTRYLTEFIVDAEQQVSESHEGNNVWSQAWFRGSPQALQKGESETGSMTDRSYEQVLLATPADQG